MAKIARTPFNASRMITGSINSNITLREKTKGYTYFVTATSAVAINVSYLDKGSYYKFILKTDSTGDIVITAPSLVGLLISDAGGVSVVEDTGTTLTIPAGAKAGTYVDLICDGSKWYARGMSAGSAFTIS
jgi:hypothetical protein